MPVRYVETPPPDYDVRHDRAPVEAKDKIEGEIAAYGWCV